MANPKKDAARKAKRTPSAKSAPESDLNFATRNYAALGAAVVSILVGFLLLSRGSITLAPILLVLGYCVLVPYGLASGQQSRRVDAAE